MILVAGPPCGGKTTFVSGLRAPTDTVLDFDDIVEELTGNRYTLDVRVIDEARAQWVDRLALHPDWVIWTAPRRSQRGRFQGQWGCAAIVVVMASMEECLRRAAVSRPASWQTSIREWFASWEPSRSGRERIVNT